MERPPILKPPPAPKPYNPFRHLKRTETRLTIAMAIRCKDGVIVASDRRGMDELAFTEDIAKIYEVENTNRSLLAFTTDSLDWLHQFLESLRDTRTNEGDLQRVKLTLQKYNHYVSDNFRSYPKDANFGGIFATLDNEEHVPKIYQFSGQTEPFEESQYSRIVIGSGARRGLVFFRLAEFVMKALHPKQDPPLWARYSTDVAAPFCLVLLKAIPAYDATVRGEEIWRIRFNKDNGQPERKSLSYNEITNDRDGLSALLHAMKKEVSPSDFLQMQEEFDILSPKLKEAFSVYAKENQDWV